MEVTLVNVRKLQIAFEESWKSILKGNRPACVDLHAVGHEILASDFWSVYMNFLDCTLVDQEDLLENFDEMVNFGSLVRESVCVKDPCDGSGFIMVPKELSQKVIVLGALP